MEIDIIITAKKYISYHLNSQFTLEDIARVCGYSTYHFSREFRKATEMSVMEFVRKERIKAARNCLLLGENILDVALEHGFDTHTGFTNAFYRYVGCNPSEFRKHEFKQTKYTKGDIKMDDKAVVIRMIEMKDVNDMWENIFSRNTPEEIKQRIQQDLDGFEDKTHFHIVAEVDNVGVGILGCGRLNKYSRFAILNDFIIHPDYQGKGLARKLLIKMKELLTGVDTLQIQCDTDKDEIKNKYVSLGFTEVFKSSDSIYLMQNIS